MISKDISASQRLKYSLDIALGILLRNWSTLKKVSELFLHSNFCLISAQSLAAFPCFFSYWKNSSRKFSIIGLILDSKFYFCTNVIVFFWFWNSNFLSGGTSRKSSSILFKTRFAHQAFTEEVVFCVFKKKEHILSWNCNIFLSGGTVRKSSSILFKTRSWVVEFLESILAF